MSTADRRLVSATHNLKARLRQALLEFERDLTEPDHICHASRKQVEEQLG